MTFGHPGHEGSNTLRPLDSLVNAPAGVRVTNLSEIGKILDIFQSHGHNEVSANPRSW